MLLTYVDESYTSDRYYMAALICTGSGVQAITRDLDKVVDAAGWAYNLPHDAELHGYELFQGRKTWKGVAPRIRIGVYNDAFEAIAKHCECVIIRGVNSAGLRERYAQPEEPHSVVLMHLLERVNTYARNSQDQALVIADEVGEQAKHRSDLALYRNSGTWGYRSTKLTQIIDTLHFAPSHASRMLQAIDLIVFLYRRMHAHTETNKKAERANE